MKETLNGKKLFTAPTVEHIEFEENAVIETSGTKEHYYGEEDGNGNWWRNGHWYDPRTGRYFD